MNQESINFVALDIGLSSSGMLHNWIRKYKRKDYSIIEKKRGKISMTITKTKNFIF